MRGYFAQVRSAGFDIGVSTGKLTKAMVDVLTHFNEGNGNAIFSLIVAGVLGNVLLAMALSRSGIASRGTAVLISAGAILSLTAAPGPVKALAVAGAVLLLAGHVLLLRGLSER